MIGWIKNYALVLVGCAALAGWLGVGVQQLRVANAQSSLAKEKQARSDDRAASEKAGRLASENYRRKEAEDADRIRTAEGKYDALQKRHADTLTAHRASDGKLRDALAAYASGGGSAKDSCTAERERASRLGVLLADGVRLQEELARGAEAQSDAVRALLEAWPK